MSKKKFGDRKDGRRIYGMSGLAQISIDLKPERCDSDVYINQKMDMTNLVKYVDKKKKQGESITYFHAFLAAVGKLLYSRPKMNYFVANRHLYEHNKVIISFVAKVTFDDNSEELMFLIPIEPKDNLSSISAKILKKIDGARNKKDHKKGANSVIDIFGKLPNIVRVPLVGFFKWTDKKGWLPSSFTEDNLYYSSLIVSNLGSIKCGAIYHNINSFGTCSGLATMGEIKDENGRKICELGINLDERIADGYYFAKSLQLLQYIFDHPELLEENANEKIETPEIR